MFIGFALLAISMLLYLTVLSFLLPRVFLRTKYHPVQLHARGLRRCLYQGKRCVVCERSMNYRRYITRYLLCQGEGRKLLQCQVSPSVRYLEYDVVMFDRYNRIFDVLTVKENLNSLYTQLLSLPDATSYVSIQLRRANKKTLMNNKPIAYLPRSRVFWFVLIAFFMTLAESIVIMASCAYAFGGVFREDFVQSIEVMLIGAGVAAVLAIIALTVIVVGHRHRKKS